MPGTNIDVAAPHTPAIAPDIIEQQPVAGPPPSKLAGHVEIGTNPGPRGGVIGKIISFAKKMLNRIFPARQASAPRVENIQQREMIFTDKLRNIGDAVLADNATTETVKQALLEAETAGAKLTTAQGSPDRMIPETFQKFCEDASTTQLNRLVLAFAGEAVADVPNQLIEHPGATQMLVALQRSLNAELGRRAEKNIADEIATAVSVMQSGGPPERVAEHLRLAFGSAAPLVKHGVVLPMPPTDQSVRKLILQHLENQPPETFGKLLAHLSHEQLALLHADVKDTGRVIERGLQNEIQQRPIRMFANLQRHTDEFLHKCQSDRPLDPRVLLSDLSGITNALRAMDKHSKTFGTHLPAELVALKTTVAAALEDTITSGKLDLSSLTAAQVTNIATTFNGLGARKAGEKLLDQARDKAMGKCTQAYQESFGRACTALSAGQPEAFLKELSQLAECRKNVFDTAAAFSSNSRQIDHSAVMEKAANEWLARLSPAEQEQLKSGVADANMGALGLTLLDAERIARAAHDPKLANQLQSMHEMLLPLTATIRAKLGSVPPKNVPLSEPMKTALGKLYGINVNGQALKLNTGHFNAQQTQMAAEFIERPADEGEMKTEKLGGHDVSWQFLRDQRAGGKPTIALETSTGTRPLINRENWPTSASYKDDRTQRVEQRVNDAREARVLEGYERLIDFCNGNVDEARVLSTYLHQGLNGGSQVAFNMDSPLHLDDGRVGTIANNPFGGGGDSLEFHLSRGPNGHPIIDVTHRYEGRNTFIPADGGSPITLSPGSTVVRHFRAELVDGSLKLLGPPAFSFHLQADDFPKDYEPPTASVIRRMTVLDDPMKLDDPLQDVLAFSTRIGKDHQVKAMRAADAFRETPNLMNATEILHECDRGDDGLHALVPQTAREHVQRANENCRQGINAAFAESKKFAEARVKSGNPGVLGSAAHDSQEFLKELALLDGKSGAALVNGAELLYRKFGDQIRDQEKVGEQLRAVRENAEAQQFDENLFGDLADAIAKRVDAEISAPMIDAIKRGEL
ncbi:hypothetical protein [Peristeroidobacter soli]|uniref:hypothetical protein n=1 Tax=Peristeroidobacter soli TaxID=2497877 RepID=UPI00101CFB3B|nr:hypothetical protein [Peristeroidobacter soli]